MSKIGDFLNKDVGSLATKVLKADVADIMKGAGRALNTDVTSIAKGAKGVLSYDLTDLFSESDAPALDEVPESADPPAVAAAPASPSEPDTPPESTAALRPVPKPSAAPQAASAPAPASATITTPPAELPKARLTEALVSRQTRAAPEGADLKLLLPFAVGNYERSRSTATGDIASDPVSVMYSGNSEAVGVTVTSCWDADEAREFLARGKVKLENSRGSEDHGWVAGIDSRGVVFTWVRSSYCYEITSPRGVSPIARFLDVFPY